MASRDREKLYQTIPGGKLNITVTCMDEEGSVLAANSYKGAANFKTVPLRDIRIWPSVRYILTTRDDTGECIRKVKVMHREITRTRREKPDPLRPWR